MAHWSVRTDAHRPVLREDEFDIDHAFVVAVQHFIQFLIELRILGLERIAFDLQFFLLTHNQFEIVVEFVDLKSQSNSVTLDMRSTYSFVRLFQALQKHRSFVMALPLCLVAVGLVLVAVQTRSMAFLTKDLNESQSNSHDESEVSLTERSPLASLSSRVSSSIRRWRISFSS